MQIYCDENSITICYIEDEKEKASNLYDLLISAENYADASEERFMNKEDGEYYELEINFE